MKQCKKNKWILPLVIVIIVTSLVTALVLIYLEPVRSLLSSFREKASMDTYEKISVFFLSR